MNVKISISKINIFPSPSGEGLGVRSMAGQFLKAAAVSTEKVVEMMKLTKRQIDVTMFAAGIGTLKGLKFAKLMKII
jgi:isopentenyl diphosphate isomerase/L-lactate dehydrogenase-like FMN-dependent dehydrogenase